MNRRMLPLLAAVGVIAGESHGDRTVRYMEADRELDEKEAALLERTALEHMARAERKRNRKRQRLSVEDQR